MSDKTKCVIGIDGGASSTRAALMGEDLEIIAEGTGGPADHFSAAVGTETLSRSLSQAVVPLLSFLAERGAIELEGVVLGLTGVSIPGKRQAASQVLEGLLARSMPGVHFDIESDAVTAWAGALAGDDGVIVIGGTGSVAYGRARGKEVQVGGFGYLFGDEGGGFRIARDAVSAALRDYDGLGPKTSLSEAVREFFEVRSVRQVPGKVYAEDIPVEEIARMCPVVIREAALGDEIACRIVEEAGRSLARLGIGALRSLGESSGVVSYAGGVFEAGDSLLRPFCDEMERELPHARVTPPRYSPLEGAGILAWKRLGFKERI